MFTKNAQPAVILLCCVCFVLFIPPNLTGAKDPNMLAAFRLELPEYGTDEFALFQQTMAMTTVGATPYGTLVNFAIPQNYFYGYPFFLTSALPILPLRLIEQLSDITIPTVVYAVIVRQLSVLFMLLAVGLLVHAWTGFRSVATSVPLFVFLAAIPAVFFNNMFWHPDSLVTLFSVLTIFCLSKDDLRLGRWYVFAAVACGLATGTKLIGLFFFLTVLIYLVLGFAHGRLSIKQVFAFGAEFAGVMAFTMIAVNPTLLIPAIATQYASALGTLAELNSWGWDVERPKSPLSWYTDALRDNFGFWWIYAIALSFCVSGIVKNPQKRLLNIMILTWTLPLSTYMLFSVGYKGARYFIPIMLPVLSCIGNVLDRAVVEWVRRRRAALYAVTISILLCAVQFAYYVVADIDIYGRVLHREARSAALEFHQQLYEEFLAGLPTHQPLTVLREARVYVPPSQYWKDLATYATLDYEYIDRTMPDLILLSREFVEAQSDKAMLSRIAPLARSQWLKGYEFYRDAQRGSIRGFRQVLTTSFGLAFFRAEHESSKP